MKALVCHELSGPEGMQLLDMPMPIPDEGELLIRVASAGLNHRDLLITQGRYQIRPELPFVAGCEVSGVVENIGARVEGFAIGDRVVAHVGNGGFAEYVACRADHAAVVPETLDLAVMGGLTVCHSTALLAFDTIRPIFAGDRVLVLGATGGAGLAAVEIVQALGGDVTALTSSKAKAKALQERYHCDTLVAYASDFANKVKGAGEFAVVFDTLGGPYSLAALRQLQVGGSLLVVGFAAGAIPHIATEDIIPNQLSVSGVSWGGWVAAHRAPQRRIWQSLFALAANQDILRYPTELVSLSDWRRAFDGMTGRGRTAKFCLIP